MKIGKKEEAAFLRSMASEREYNIVIRAITDGADVWIFQTLDEVDRDATVPAEDKEKYKEFVRGDLDKGAAFSFLYRNPLYHTYRKYEKIIGDDPSPLRPDLPGGEYRSKPNQSPITGYAA